MNKKNLYIQLIIAAGAALLFLPFLGKVHLFDWDEINFAESAREMIVTGDYLTVRIFFEPFWEKPPLFIWLQVLSLKLFGINEFAARFPNAICGIVTLLLLFNIGNKLYNKQFGLLWALAFCGSILPFLYFKSGIIDPWFNLFIFLGIVSWVKTIESGIPKEKYLYAILSATSIGLAVLTKGPVSVLIFGMVAFVLFLLNGFRIGLNWKHITTFVFTLIIVGGFWFILMALSGNFEIIQDFIVYQIRLFNTKDAGHGGFPMYHFVILLFGVFPASVFAILGHKYADSNDNNKMLHLAMISLLWIVLLLFSIVKTKIVHYSSLTYFPISYLAAYSTYQILNGKYIFKKWLKICLIIVGAIPAILVSSLPFIIANKNKFIENGMLTDVFTIGNLQAETGWTNAHSLVGIVFLIILILTIFSFDKKPDIKVYGIFSATVLFTVLSITLFTPGAENISQRAVIEFIKEKSVEDAYIRSFHKSYAVLFYGNRLPGNTPKQFDKGWLTSADIDKDAYFIMRNNKIEEVQRYFPRVEILYEKNGYAFGINRVNKIEN